MSPCLRSLFFAFLGVASGFAPAMRPLASRAPTQQRASALVMDIERTVSAAKLARTQRLAACTKPVHTMCHPHGGERLSHARQH